jgi:hypothetical protein
MSRRGAREREPGGTDQPCVDWRVCLPLPRRRASRGVRRRGLCSMRSSTAALHTRRCSPWPFTRSFSDSSRFAISAGSSSLARTGDAPRCKRGAWATPDVRPSQYCHEKPITSIDAGRTPGDELRGRTTRTRVRGDREVHVDGAGRNPLGPAVRFSLSRGSKRVERTEGVSGANRLSARRCRGEVARVAVLIGSTILANYN